jgi:hypothetical protein
MMLDAQRGKVVAHQLGGAVLLESELGMTMKIAPQRGVFVEPAADMGNGSHGKRRLNRQGGQ